MDGFDFNLFYRKAEEDTTRQQMLDGAHCLYGAYKAFTDVGFSKEQAFELIKIQMSAAMRKV